MSGNRPSSSSSGRATAAGTPVSRGPKYRGIGVVDVRDAVLGAVHQGDEGGEPAEDLADGEVRQRVRRGVVGPVERAGPVGCLLGLPAVLTAGRRDGTAVGPRCGAGAAFRGNGRSSA